MAYIKSMLQDFELIDRFSIPESKLTNFVQTIRKLYSTHNNPFHNFFHGFSVMHSTYIILATTRATELYEVHDMLALLIASLCHDV